MVNKNRKYPYGNFNFKTGKMDKRTIHPLRKHKFRQGGGYLVLYDGAYKVASVRLKDLKFSGGSKYFGILKEELRKNYIKRIIKRRKK